MSDGLIAGHLTSPSLDLRSVLPFRTVNVRGMPGHDPGMQRHHLLPHQLITVRALSRMVQTAGKARIGFDDFRRNGLLLPATERTASLLALPLHRGPHRQYNAMVLERVGRIEARWACLRLRDDEAALGEALFRLDLLQRALRRRLLSPRGGALASNRRDPALREDAFADLDAMAEALWDDSGVADEESVGGRLIFT